MEGGRGGFKAWNLRAHLEADNLLENNLLESWIPLLHLNGTSCWKEGKDERKDERIYTYICDPCFLKNFVM